MVLLGAWERTGFLVCWLLRSGCKHSAHEERRNAYGSWASSTWPDASPGQQDFNKGWRDGGGLGFVKWSMSQRTFTLRIPHTLVAQFRFCEYSEGQVCVQTCSAASITWPSFMAYATFAQEGRPTFGSHSMFTKRVDGRGRDACTFSYCIFRCKFDGRSKGDVPR